MREAAAAGLLVSLARFGAVGLINSAVAYAAFALTLSLGLHYTIATLAGGAAGVLLGFRLHGRFVFRDRPGQLWRFVLVFLVIYGLSLAVQAGARPAAGGYLAGILAMGVTVPTSYLLNRWLVFRGPAVRPDSGGVR